jgi:hypothetical protein
MCWPGFYLAFLGKNQFQAHLSGCPYPVPLGCRIEVPISLLVWARGSIQLLQYAYVVSAYWFNWVQKDGTQETLISENRVFIQANSHGTFLWILMPVSTTLASRELLRPSPKPRSPCHVFLADEGVCSCAPGDPHSCLQCRSSSRFTRDTQWSSGEGARSQAVAASVSGSWGTPDSMVSDVKKASKALGSGLSLYTLWWHHHFCYPHCHLRVGLLAYQLVTLQLASKPNTH